MISKQLLLCLLGTKIKKMEEIYEFYYFVSQKIWVPIFNHLLSSFVSKVFEQANIKF